MRYRKKPVEIDATQWWRNGDHPDDYANDLYDGLAVWPVDYQRANNWEGQVVRYYRHPPVNPDTGEVSAADNAILMGNVRHDEVPS